MVSCDFRRVIRISDKIVVGPLETLKKWSVFWEHCIDINKPAMNISGLISAWEFWQFSDRQTPIVGVLFTTFSDFFRLIRLCITRCHYELWWNTEISTKLNKKLRSYIYDRYLIPVSYNNAFFPMAMLFKKLLFKISDTCQENTSARTSFWIKIGLRCLCIYQNRHSGTYASLRMLRNICEDTFFK